MSVIRSDMEAVLKAGAPSPWLGRGAWVIAAIAAVAAVGAAYWWVVQPAEPAVQYRTVAAATGDLFITVSATGTVQPVNQVQVGGEISGTVQAVLVDFNDHVQAGQVLARLDATKLKAQIDHVRAALDVARANLAGAQVTTAERDRDLARIRPLAGGGFASRQDLEAAQSAYDRAVAARDSAAAQVRLSQADLSANEADLAKMDIRSPIDGMVLKRSVDPGQTIAASLQAPVLFTIAEDLARMNVLIDVDEADAARVREGQTATFTVEAFPDRTFGGTLTQLRYLPETVGGVVTYKGVLAVDNADLALRPGMTATADIAVTEVHGGALIPNGALRYAPPAAATTGGGFFAVFQPPKQPAPDGAAKLPAGQRRVWVLRDGVAVPVLVRIGMSDGNLTEVVDGGIAPGAALIVETVAKP